MTRPDALGTEICNALGLEATMVARLSIVIEAGHLPVVEVTYRPDTVAAAALPPLIATYELRPR